MKNVKRLIILLIIILLIAAVILGFSLLKKKNTIKEIQEEVPEPVEEVADTTIQKLDNYNRYMAISQSVNTYFANIAYKSEKIIYDLTDRDMIEKQGLTQNGILEKVQKIQNEQPIVKIDQIQMQDDFVFPIFLIKGMIYDVPYQASAEDEFMMDIDYRKVDEKTVIKSEIYLIMRVDLNNQTYSIEEISQNRYQNIIDQKETIEKKEIDKNSSNAFSGYKNVTDEEICELLIQDYEKDTLLNQDRAYEHLNQDYAKKRFTSKEEYKNYVTSQKNKSGILKLNQYKVTKTQEYTQYMCLDRIGNYYIFRVTSPTDYTVILDTYTIDLPEVVSQYQQADTERKVQLNLIKVFSAINEGDYRYAYQKLNQNFRQTNFPTQTDFERYVKEMFYERNTIGIGNFETFDYVHRYEVTIKDETQPNATYSVKKTFSMSLGEGTDFEYSFNM